MTQGDRNLHLLLRSLSALVVVGALMVAGCTSQTASSPTLPSTIPARESGLSPADPHLSDRLVLTTVRVPAGVTINGTLVVTNHGPKPINLNHGCAPHYEVALTNRHYRPTVVVPTECADRPLLLEPGINRFPITVITTYLACGSPGTASVPACENQTAPNLPVGKYEAVLFGEGLALPAPTPVLVALTPGSQK